MQKDYNIGLSVLRAIMCFEVVLFHCWDAENATGIMQIFRWLRTFAVPVFILMSFILVQKTLVEHNKEKIRNRFERLFIPQIGWAIIYLCAYKVLDVLFDCQLKVGIADLIWQILTGTSQLNPTMWYQVALILLTLLFLLIILLFKRKYMVVLYLLGAVTIFTQYSGMNMVFSNLRFELRYMIGFSLEMIPIAIAGFAIAYNNILDELCKNKYLTVGFGIFTVGIVATYGVFTEVPGYGYQGISMIVISFALVALFYAMPLLQLPAPILAVIEKATRYTMGIYCMHRLIATILNVIVTKAKINISINSFGICIFIYAICYLLSWLGTRICKKTRLRSLFS